MKFNKWILGLSVAIALAVSAEAQVTQTTGADGVTTTTTNTGTSSGGVWEDAAKLLGDVGLSDNPTNYAGGVFFGAKTDFKQYSIGLYVIENVSQNVGVIAGVDQLFGGGKIGSENIVSGGLTLSAPTHPLRFLSSSTNSFFYTFKTTSYAIAMASMPIGGTGSAGGGLGAITRAGFNFDIYNLDGWQLGAGIDYGKRTGAGAYNGNWIDLTVNIRKGF